MPAIALAFADLGHPDAGVEAVGEHLLKEGDEQGVVEEIAEGVVKLDMVLQAHFIGIVAGYFDSIQIDEEKVESVLRENILAGKVFMVGAGVGEAVDGAGQGIQESHERVTACPALDQRLEKCLHTTAAIQVFQDGDVAGDEAGDPALHVGHGAWCAHVVLLQVMRGDPSAAIALALEGVPDQAQAAAAAALFDEIRPHAPYHAFA